jgi:hypothetical protein
MKVKPLVQFGFQIITVVSLLFTSVASVSAQGGGGDIIGQVSVSVSKELPRRTMPNGATQPLPGGGTATATASLSWSQAVMDGIARSSLNASTVSIFYVCARVENLLLNGVPNGGTTNQCGNRGAGGSITATKRLWVDPVAGNRWQVNTRHSFQRSGWSGWYPYLQAGPCTVQGSSCF